jgi:glutathione S-transferase
MRRMLSIRLEPARPTRVLRSRHNGAPVLRLYTIPFSTNVNRVEMALRFKGLEWEDVPVDVETRAEVVAVSGQELVPVLQAGDEVIPDSPAILEWLEAHHPDPPMFPAAERERAQVRVFIEWFNFTWKVAPSRITDEEGDLDAWRATMLRHLGVFEGLLEGRKFLFGEYGIADMIAWPFLRYAASIDPADDERFHQVLHEAQPLDNHPRVRRWIDAVDAQRRHQ